MDKIAGLSLTTAFALGFGAQAVASAVGISGPGSVPYNLQIWEDGSRIYSQIQSPAFADPQGHFLPGDQALYYDDAGYVICHSSGVPLKRIRYGREFGVDYGEKRPFVIIYQGWVEDSGHNVNMSIELDPGPASTPLVQVVRYSTNRAVITDPPSLQFGDLVREVETGLGDNVVGNALTFRMDETQPNDPTWFVTVQFMISPPPDTGFIEPLHFTAYSTSTNDPAYTEGGQMGIHIISRVGMRFDITVVPEPAMAGLFTLGSSVLLIRRKSCRRGE